MNSLYVVLEQGVAGGGVVAVRTGLVPDVLVDHLDVVREVTSATRLESALVANQVLDLVVHRLDVRFHVTRVVGPVKINFIYHPN